jgi:hypothetical protein
MKVINYIYDNYNERGCKAFESKVKKILKGANLNANEVICHNAWWEKSTGYGRYMRKASIEVNGVDITLTDVTNDSWGWDAWDEPTTKDKRALFLAVLTELVNELNDETQN